MFNAPWITWHLRCLSAGTALVTSKLLKPQYLQHQGAGGQCVCTLVMTPVPGHKAQLCQQPVCENLGELANLSEDGCLWMQGNLTALS